MSDDNKCDIVISVNPKEVKLECGDEKKDVSNDEVISIADTIIKDASEALGEIKEIRLKIDTDKILVEVDTPEGKVEGEISEPEVVKTVKSAIE